MAVRRAITDHWRVPRADAVPRIDAPTPSEPRESDEWVLLAGGRSALKPPKVPSPRALLLQFVLTAVILVVTVGIVGTLVIKHVAEEQAVREVAQLTDVLGQSVVQPALTDEMTSSPATATRVLDRVLRPSLSNRLLLRVKVWTTSGLVLYSDEPRLIGKSFPLDDEAHEALSASRTTADLTNLNRPENRFERGHGQLLEVYRPMSTPDGTPLLLETYFRYDTVQEQSTELWRGFGGILLSCIGALLVLLVPLFLLFARRSRRAQQQREDLARRAVEASDEERRRIGASLHDGAVQQLVAASFDVAGKAEKARTAGDTDQAAQLDEVASTVRGTIGNLRSLLVEIYPPSVDTAGLAAALRDLSRSVVDGHAEVDLDIDDAAARRLPQPVQEEMFRVAQECLRNAVKHARANRVGVRLSALPAGGVRLAIDDDGVGFDTTATAAAGDEGHLGLRLMADAARRCAGVLAVASRPGHGATFRMDVAAT